MLYSLAMNFFGGFIGNVKDVVCKGRDRMGESYRAIEKARIEDNNIVIFISDNGPTKTSGTITELNHGSAGPWRFERLGDRPVPAIYRRLSEVP